MDVVNIQDLVPDLDKTIEKLFSRSANSLCCIVLIKIIQFIYIYIYDYIYWIMIIGTQVTVLFLIKTDCGLCSFSRVSM